MTTIFEYCYRVSLQSRLDDYCSDLIMDNPTISDFYFEIIGQDIDIYDFIVGELRDELYSMKKGQK